MGLNKSVIWSNQHLKQSWKQTFMNCIGAIEEKEANK
jgi:hypothetical protein